jgi:uncharacterized membrane protein YtjA (UPF0391 family)
LSLARNAAAAPETTAAMLKWAIIFLVISLVAGALGFTGVAAGASRIAKILFGVFLAICLVFLVMALLIGEALF